MSNGHARLGPSNHRWPKCPGSVAKEAGYPDIPGEAAIDGTGSHLLLELCMNHGVMALMYEGQIIGVNHADNPRGWLVHKDRCERVQMCLDYIDRRQTELLTEYDRVEVVAEQITNPGKTYGRDDWWGTVDITIRAYDNADQCRFIEVCDYKDGKGYVAVKDKNSGELNTQHVSYGMGQAIEVIGTGDQKTLPYKTDNIDGVRLSVVQPKTNPPVRYEDVTIDTLTNAADTMAIAAFATDSAEAELVAGPHCRWCKYRNDCTEKSQESIGVIKKMTSEDNPLIKIINGVGVVDVKQLTPLQLAELADSKGGIMSLYDIIDKEIQSRLESGVEVKGYDMSPGNGSRKWNVNDDEMIKTFKSMRLKRDDYYPPKLVSAPALLKSGKLTDKQKKKLETDYVSFVAGKLTLKKVAPKQETKSVDFFAEVPEKTTTPLNFL